MIWNDLTGMEWDEMKWHIMGLERGGVGCTRRGEMRKVERARRK